MLSGRYCVDWRMPEMVGSELGLGLEVSLLLPRLVSSGVGIVDFSWWVFPGWEYRMAWK